MWHSSWIKSNFTLRHWHVLIVNIQWNIMIEKQNITRTFFFLQMPCIFLSIKMNIGYQMIWMSPIYYRISVYRGYVWYDSVHSTTITTIKFRSDLPSRMTPNSSPLRASYGGVFRELSKEKWPRYIESALYSDKSPVDICRLPGVSN